MSDVESPNFFDRVRTDSSPEFTFITISNLSSKLYLDLLDIQNAPLKQRWLF